jgi:6-phosphogluconolactonase (cycloisomerase 2 family)
MRTRFTWIVATLVLIAIGFTMACSNTYSTSNNGLVVVPTQGEAVMQTFSLDLGNGHLSQINNVNGPPTPGLPTQVVLNPAGTFAFVIVQQNAVLPSSQNGITSYQVASDGKLSSVGTISVTNPVALAVDSAGKFLFVGQGAAGTVSVFSIGSNGALSEVGKPTSLPDQPGGQAPSASALAVTSTVYPIQFAPCSGFTAPTTENLYVADSVNYVLLNYSVSSAGDLTLVPTVATATLGVPTGTVPSGVAVDPCNRFVYVSNAIPNNSVSAYTICNAVSLANNCPIADYHLQTVTGSPFPAGDNPGPLTEDAYGNFLYVVDTGSDQVSGYRISASNGSLTAFTGAAISTGSGPTSIAIRSDDSWMFVSNLNAATLSQYAISPASGTLTPQPATSTFNYPSGVAVK